MSDLFSPRQVAQALGVSESSLKRWCDKGIVKTLSTAGGHRRLALGSVLDFVRQSKHPLVRPEILGLPAQTGGKHRSLSAALQGLVKALLAGDEATCRRIVFDQYLAGEPLSVIGDELVSAVFREVGAKWECGEAEVYQERLGCRIMARIINELRLCLPLPAATAPLAIGGSLEGDLYELPTTLVEATLVESDWRATSLGSNLPVATLLAAIRQHQPRLFWLSVSYLANETAFVEKFAELASAVTDQTTVVIGGRALHPELRQQLSAGIYCDSLQRLQGFVATLMSGIK